MPETSNTVGEARSAERCKAAYSGSSWAILVIVFIPLVLLAAFIMADTAGHNLATSEPHLALRIAPWQPIAANQLAQKEMASAAGELDASEDLARRALVSDPLDSHALSLLGAAAERRGDLARAETLMSRAAARTWRNPGPHFWLFAQAIRRGKFEEALAQADGVLRVASDNSATIFPILTLLAVDPDGMAALEETLAANPPWRSSFLRQAVTKGASDLFMTRLYQSLIKSNQPPTTVEIRPYVDRLIQLGRFNEAYENWRAMSSQTRTPPQFPYNGDFAAPLDGLPFNWVFDLVSGAEIDITEVLEGDSRALRIQFPGARATLGRVGQLLMLAPGEYRLEFLVKAEDLRTERGLVWQVSCAESRSVLAETVPITGTTPWTELKVTFSVPSSDCNAQWLKVVLPARSASESKIEGDVWFQRIRVLSVEPETTPTR
jgi:tetratricopeptide (TPR) repeat protein